MKKHQHSCQVTSLHKGDTNKINWAKFFDRKFISLFLFE